MATTVNIDVFDLTNNERPIAIIGQPNPCYNYPATSRETRQLIQIADYNVFLAGTKILIDGYNINEYFPESGGGGGGGVTPYQVQQMIDASTDPINERIDKVEAEIEDLESDTSITEYTKGEEVKAGKVVYITPGQLYQATTDFTTNNDPSLTPEEALAADIAAGNLTPITDADVSDLHNRVDALEEWKPGVDDDISYLKIAIANAEEVEYYATFDAFPAEGKDDIIYVDKSEGKTYGWNATTEAYELMNANNIVDGSIFNSIL